VSSPQAILIHATTASTGSIDIVSIDVDISDVDYTSVNLFAGV